MSLNLCRQVRLGQEIECLLRHFEIVQGQRREIEFVERRDIVVGKTYLLVGDGFVVDVREREGNRKIEFFTDKF